MPILSKVARSDVHSIAVHMYGICGSADRRLIVLYGGRLDLIVHDPLSSVHALLSV